MIAGYLKSYVLRSGRMSDAQRRSYETLRGRYCVDGDAPEASRATPVQFEKIFGNRNPVVVEIGFGMGIATAEIAQARPEVNYLGIEVHRPGIGRLLWEIEKRGLENVRILEGDAVEALDARVAEGCLAALHLFFPDPWPKKRHHKRRLVTRPVTDLLASRLEPGGYLYMVTDWADYGEWALRELAATPGLKNRYDGFAPRQSWRPQTKFEMKGVEKNHEIRELFFVKEGSGE